MALGVPDREVSNHAKRERMTAVARVAPVRAELATLLRATERTRARSLVIMHRAASAIDRAESTRQAVARDRRAREHALERRRRARLAAVHALIEDHRVLAKRLAGHFASRGQPLEDLEQVACVGLVTAAKRFDPARGVRFATFARATILGELKKHFRDHAWSVHVPRPMQELYLEARAVTEDLTHGLGRAPTAEEIAGRIGATADDVVEAIEAAHAMHVDSLDLPAGDEPGDRPFEYGCDDLGFVRVEERSWLVPALAALPERERTILRLRFFEGLSQSAIAARVGISQMHVSRLLSRSLAQLREAAPPT